MRALSILLACGLVAVASAQTFPCPVVDELEEGAAAPATAAGGYQPLDIDQNNIDDLAIFANISFSQWLIQDDNVTLCNATNTLEYGISVLSACTQVVAGTNTAVQYGVIYNCLLDDGTVYVEDRIVMDAIIYTPLPAGGSNSSPQVADVYPDPDALDEEDVYIATPDSPSTAPAVAPFAGAGGVPSQDIVTFSNDDSR